MGSIASTAAADAWRAALADAVGVGCRSGRADAARWPRVHGGDPVERRTRGRRSGRRRSCCRRSACSTDGSVDDADRGARTRTASRTRIHSRWSSTWEALTRGAGGGRQPVTPAPAALRIVEERPDRAAWERTVGLFAGSGRPRPDRQGRAGTARRASVPRRISTSWRRCGTWPGPPRKARPSRSPGMGRPSWARPRSASSARSGRSFETVAIAGSAARGRGPGRGRPACRGPPREREGARGTRRRRRHAPDQPHADRRDARRRRRAGDPAAAATSSTWRPRSPARCATRPACSRWPAACTRRRRSAGRRATSRSGSSRSTRRSIAAGTPVRSAGSAPTATAR